MEQFFEEVFAQANELQYAYTTCDAADRPNFRVPSVIVSTKTENIFTIILYTNISIYRRIWMKLIQLPA